MYKPILVMLHTGSTFLFSVMVCVIFPGKFAASIPLCCRGIRDHNYIGSEKFRAMLSCLDWGDFEILVSF